MNNINPIYNANINYIPQFKAKKEHPVVSNPVKLKPISDLQGYNALASYNLGLLANKNIDIPVLTPPDIETDVNKIKGKKIYNSEGTLIRIVDENDSYRKDYNIVDNKLEYYVNLDKNTGERLSACYFSDNGNCDSVFIEYPDGSRVDTGYDEYGKLTYKRKDFADDRSYFYDCKNKQYVFDKYTPKVNYNVILDSDKNFVEASVLNDGKYPNYEIKFYNNKPYKVNIEANNNLPNKILDKDLVDLKGLEPAPFEDFDIEKVQNIDGEKKYYSDGTLEKVVAKDGTVYELDYNHKDLVIKKGNKEFRKDIDDYRTMTSITEYLEDGGEKITRYSDNMDGSSVQLKNGNASTWVEYGGDGNVYYSENVDGKEILKVAYDKDGNLLEYDKK